MARTSLAAAKAELVGLLVDPHGRSYVDGVVATYGYEPRAGNRAKPVAVTVSTGGLDPDFYLLTVRVYVDIDEIDEEDGQALLDELMPALDDLLTSGFGPSDWRVEYRDDLRAFIGTSLLRCGREDYY